jgi:hypothetical protein
MLTAPCGGRSGLPNVAACATPAAAAAAADVAATMFRRDMSFNQSSRNKVFMPKSLQDLGFPFIGYSMVNGIAV